MPIASGEAHKKNGDGPDFAALILVVAAAVAARSWLLWSTPLVPGMNGGYYLVQARALLEHGALGIPDLPLTFLLQAAFAKLVQLTTGRSLETSILLAVRLCDAILPTLVAIPVFLLGRNWCVRTGRSVWPAAVAAALAVLGMPALSMVGDFEKNSLGLAWLAGLIVALHAWMTQRTCGRAAAVLVLLGLCGLTHIGVFGAALLLTALTWAADLALLRGKEGLRTLRHIGAVAAAGAAVVALVAGVVLWKFDPARIQRLTRALSHPIVFVQTGGHAGDKNFHAFPPSGGTSDQLRPPPGAQPRRADRGHMGPPGQGMLPQGVPTGLFFLVAVGALALPFRRRFGLPLADRATTIGCAVTVVLLTGPWMQDDVMMRLRLIAMIPAAFAAVFVMVHLPGRWSASLCATAVLALTAATSIPLLSRGGHPTISAAAFGELRALTAQVTQPNRTLVVARHGLEWWSAWTLHTHIAQSRAVLASDWSKYDTVLFIQEKGTRRHGGERPDRKPMDRRGPPPGFGGPQGGPPMMEAEIPSDAEILHDGTYFRLARVRKPVEALTPPGGKPQPKRFQAPFMEIMAP